MNQADASSPPHSGGDDEGEVEESSAEDEERVGAHTSEPHRRAPDGGEGESSEAEQEHRGDEEPGESANESPPGAEPSDVEDDSSEVEEELSSLGNVLEELSEPSKVKLGDDTSAEAVAEAVAKVAKQKVTEVTTELINTRNRLGQLEKSLEQIQDEKQHLERDRAQLQDEIDAIEEEKDQLHDRMLRAAADLENYRRRAEREKEELMRYGIKDVVLELIPAVDNMERALEHAREQTEDEDNSIVDGVEMVYKQILTALEKHGVEGFDSVGEQFDPERHDAIQQVETPDHSTGTIIEEFQKGYFLHDRLVRAALVSVAKHVGPPQEESAKNEEQAEASEGESLEGQSSKADDSDGEGSEADPGPSEAEVGEAPQGEAHWSEEETVVDTSVPESDEEPEGHAPDDETDVELAPREGSEFGAGDSDASTPGQGGADEGSGADAKGDEPGDSTPF